MLESVNTIATTSPKGIDSEIDEWTRAGGKFISYGGVPHDPNLTGRQAFEHWFQNRGFQDARFSGMLADEFGGRQNPLYP